MLKSIEIELKVGLFVTIGVALIMLAILLLGGASSLFTRNNTYTSHFQSVEGLVTGAKVVLSGIQVGTVEAVSFDQETRNIVVQMRVQKKHEEWIRKNSTAEILTQGVLGDKFISIVPGTEDSPVLPDKSEIPNRPTKDLTQFINKGDQLMISLNRLAVSLEHLVRSFEAGNRSETFFEGMANTAKNMAVISSKLSEDVDKLQLRAISKNLNNILEKINNGTGTLGALVNDPSLFYDTKALMGGANRNRVIRNLVRKTIKESEEKQAEEKKK